MVVKEEYFKNSNTGVMIKKETITETRIKGLPDFYYDINGKAIGSPDLTGFVPISEKKFLRERNKSKKSFKI